MTQQTYQENAHPKMNRLLAILVPGDYDALMQHAKVVLLKLRKHLHQQDERVDAVYFPITSMVSLLVKIDGTYAVLKIFNIGGDVHTKL